MVAAPCTVASKAACCRLHRSPALLSFNRQPSMMISRAEGPLMRPGKAMAVMRLRGAQVLGFGLSQGSLQPEGS